jgi:hypothetical protein
VALAATMAASPASLGLSALAAGCVALPRLRWDPAAGLPNRRDDGGLPSTGERAAFRSESGVPTVRPRGVLAGRSCGVLAVRFRGVLTGRSCGVPAGLSRGGDAA